MKRFLTVLALMVISFLVLAAPIEAKDQNEPLTLQWEYYDVDLPYISGWVLYWSDVSGSGYVTAVDIPLSPGEGETHTSSQVLLIAGNPGVTVRKYFVLTAKGTNGPESPYSNEVNRSWVIPLTAPFNFAIPVTVERMSK